ncbi:MAG: NAD-dependent epimerase/dehydratase family protein [bacterium]
MKVFVTGANGFVGSALCRKLLERGDTVLGLVRKTSDLSLLEGVTIQKIIGSLDNKDSYSQVLKDVEVVYHIAGAVSDWGSLEYFRNVNVEGTHKLIQAAVGKKVKRFVYVSSIVVHSHVDSCDLNEQSPQLDTPFPYVQTKREAERLVMSYHKEKKIEVTIVRPGDIYGPGDRVSLLKMTSLLEKGTMGYIGGGKTIGALTYVNNLADGLILAGTKKQAAGEAYIITDGKKISWREYFEALTKELNVPAPRFSLPPVIAGIIANVLEFVYRVFHIKKRPPLTKYLVTHLRGDFHFRIDKAKKMLGYKPSTDFKQAIKETAAWYKKVVRNN